MNTQIHAYRDLPAISAKLRAAFPEQATAEQLQTMPSNTHGTADPTGGADVSRSTLDPRREENTEIPAKGGGGREGDYRQSEAGAWHSPASKTADADGRCNDHPHGQSARRASATSAESVEGRSFGSQRVESPRFHSPFEAENIRQMRKDWLDSAEPLLILMLAALIGAAVFIVADTYQPHMLIGGFFE